MSRRCPHCRKAFEPSRGNQHYCGRKCYSAVYGVVNREKIRKRRSTHRAANRDALNKRSAAYYAANWEAIDQRHAAYYAANRGGILKRRAAYYVANRERIARRAAARYAAKKMEKQRLAQTDPPLTSRRLARVPELRGVRCCGSPPGDTAAPPATSPPALTGWPKARRKNN